ncbi:MAG: RNA polymerase sigma factor [Myxococcota bacterium]|nr:RNA polymerase sigma factor [Myxococcota bacterium]
MRVLEGGASGGSAGPAVRATDDDHALLARAAAGDDVAVRRLYRDHVDRIHRTVARILGSDDSDVEDVVQQTFLAALDGAARFDGRSKVSTWIIGIATRRALDQSRERWRRSRWQRVGEMVGLGRAAARPDDLHDSRALAEWALAKLTPEQRTVFVLHEVEGHTLAEISAMTSTGISTLHARLVAGRKRLDAALATIGHESDAIGAQGGDDHDGA